MCLKRILRQVLLKEGECLKIPLGPLRGLKFYFDSSVAIRLYLGQLEKKVFHFIQKNRQLFPRKMVFFDVGASFGMYSLFFAREKENTVYAFEPGPIPLGLLQKNISINELSVRVIPRACSDKTGKAAFYKNHYHMMWSLSEGWARRDTSSELEKILVPTISLDDFCYQKNIFPDLIKVDIEGCFGLMLIGSEKMIKNKRPYFIIESHTPEEDDAIGKFCLNSKYTAFRINSGKLVTNLLATYPDECGVWGTVFLIPSEKSPASKILLK